VADKITLTLHEGNDETVALTITPAGDDDLLDVDQLELILKDDQCDPDSDGLTLTSADPGEILILTHTAEEITAEAYIPASALAEPYDRWWRLDAVTTSGDRRTALYGPVTVIDL
jgi:hypothetical protein